MNKTVKKSKVIAIIRKDANLRGTLFGIKKGDACVIGGLINAAKLRDLYFSPKFNGSRQGSVTYMPIGFIDLLYKKYGLNRGQLEKLQQINDTVMNIRSRRRQLIAAVKAM